MTDDLVVTDLIRRFQGGDPQAADRLFVHYARKLTEIAERRLGRDVAGRLGGEDVVQSVFRTFLRRNAAGEFRFDSSAGLWRLLVEMTVRKAWARYRRHTAGVRDVGRETGDAWLVEVVSREPGPEEAALLLDLIGALLHGLPEEYGRLLELLVQGHSKTEAAETLGLSRQTVYRALKVLRRRLESLDPD